VLGVGVNIDVEPTEFPRELRTSAGSLRSVFGETPDRRDILGWFLPELEKRLERADRLGGELRTNLVTMGRAYESASGRGVAIDVDDQMRLVVRYPDGRTDAVSSRTVGESA
jgi:BirA family biotin operon repressor/biotin-[acetyl-CoA-carboxylase] ligase